jgi:hypothetical protein
MHVDAAVTTRRSCMIQHGDTLARSSQTEKSAAAVTRSPHAGVVADGSAADTMYARRRATYPAVFRAHRGSTKSACQRRATAPKKDLSVKLLELVKPALHGTLR